MRTLRLTLAGLAGLGLYLVLIQPAFALSLWLKATGQGADCSWQRVLTIPWTAARLAEIQKVATTQVTRIQATPDGLELYAVPGRNFWIPAGEKSGWGGAQTLAYILAEQTWLNEIASEFSVRKGDVVVDVGAHVGTFGADALSRGASKVIMIEVSPVNAECIRRNFAAEIANGRVVLIAEGAWSSESTMEFVSGVSNSGTGSLVKKEEGGTKIQVRVRRIDDMLREYRIGRVDFVKMDIEGAEREALSGAGELLKTHHPRLMLDAYHREDDPTLLPAIVRAARPGYKLHCPFCTAGGDKAAGLAPYAVFFY